jgi:rod shape-determining protein MreB and related proteins
MANEAVYVGMDLGTYKTSVASSMGIRDYVLSAVGWPKDHIARTLLGRDVVFGKDLTEHRLAIHSVRPFEKGVLKYNTHDEVGVPADQVELHKQAAKLLVEHAVSLTKPPKGSKIYGVIGAPSRATALNKAVLLEAARDAFEGVMIVSEPFTIAYGMNRLTDTLVVDIGAGTIDICPLYGIYPSDEEQITLPIGGDYVDDQFTMLLKEHYPDIQVTPNMVREIKEKYGFVHDVNEKAVVTLPCSGRPRQLDVSELLKEACRRIVGPIVESLREMMERFDPEFQQRMQNNIIIGGGGSQLKGLDRVIEEALAEHGGAKVRRVYDAVFAGAVGALKLAMSMPVESWEQLSTPQMQANALMSV